MGGMMSQIPGMSGGGAGSSGGGVGGGMSFPGMPQQNGSEQDMPSQNIMGMQTPDFAGGMWRGSETNGAQQAALANAEAGKSSSGGNGQTLQSLGQSTKMMGQTPEQAISDTGAQIQSMPSNLNNNAMANNQYGLSLFQQNQQPSNLGLGATPLSDPSSIPNKNYGVGNSALGNVSLM